MWGKLIMVSSALKSHSDAVQRTSVSDDAVRGVAGKGDSAPPGSAVSP